MLLSKEEFLKKHENVLRTGLVTESYIEDMFDILEESTKTDIKATRSQIRRLFSHMLKYQYQKEKQTGSWINTIRQASTEIQDQCKTSKAIYNTFGDDHLNDIYNDAKRDASRETGLSTRDFPQYRPDIFNKDNIINDTFIDDYLLKYAYTHEAKKYLYLI